MKLFRPFVFLAAIAVALTLPTTGQAYKYSGHKWATRSVPYYVNPANSGVTAAKTIDAVQQGAAAWSAQSNADFSFYYAGTTTGNSFAYNHKNEVFFRGSSGSLVAETYRWYDGTGAIVDADIVFYSGAHKFTTTDGSCSGAMVIENFATHEFGHALGLSHSGNTAATMYPSSKTCATAWMSLASDDLNGIEALYPGTRSTTTTTTTAPSVNISSPDNGMTTSEGTNVTLAGSASDKKDGNISASIVWKSSVDGKLGTGAKLTHALSAGSHVITATVKNSAGKTAKQTVSVTVTRTETAKSTSGISLTAEGFLKKGLQRANLTWKGADGAKVEIFRNGTLIAKTGNDGSKVDAINATGSGTYYYQVCERLAVKCSAKVKVVF
jgi:hypothetical protein